MEPSTASAVSADEASAMPTAITVPPGYRFRPTDQELLQYFLPRMLDGTLPETCPIRRVALLDHSPQDLLFLSPLPKDEGQWFFFCQAQLRHRTGGRACRATRTGFWKSTSFDKDVVSRSGGALLGKRKSLVFYLGKKQKTDWVLHELRLTAGAPQLGAWVVCKLFFKGQLEHALEPEASHPCPGPLPIQIDESLGNVIRTGAVASQPTSQQAQATFEPQHNLTLDPTESQSVDNTKLLLPAASPAAALGLEEVFVDETSAPWQSDCVSGAHIETEQGTSLEQGHSAPAPAPAPVLTGASLTSWLKDNEFYLETFLGHEDGLEGHSLFTVSEEVANAYLGDKFLE